eukprot:1160257-Pelagomonas_calceolata.AAC.1
MYVCKHNCKSTIQQYPHARAHARAHTHTHTRSADLPPQSKGFPLQLFDLRVQGLAVLKQFQNLQAYRCSSLGPSACIWMQHLMTTATYHQVAADLDSPPDERGLKYRVHFAVAVIDLCIQLNTARILGCRTHAIPKKDRALHPAQDSQQSGLRVWKGTPVCQQH